MSHQDQFHKPKRDIVNDVINLCNCSPEAITEITYMLQQNVLALKDIEVEANKSARISAEVLYITQKEVKKKGLGTYDFILRHLKNIKSNSTTFLNVDNYISEMESKIKNLETTKDSDLEV